MQHDVETQSRNMLGAATDSWRAAAPVRQSWDRSDGYLLSVLIFLAVALVGAVVCTTSHDLLGTALLVGGDAVIILIFVDYVRQP